MKNYDRKNIIVALLLYCRNNRALHHTSDRGPTRIVNIIIKSLLLTVTGRSRPHFSYILCGSMSSEKRQKKQNRERQTAGSAAVKPVRACQVNGG